MTEKRFTIHGSMVCDRDMEIPITLWQDKEQQKKFCDTLNYFHEENLRLKQENKELQFAYDECSNNKLFSRRKLEIENKNLKDENQALKEALRELKEIGDYQADRIKELQGFEDIVFNSLNGKIKRGEKAIEWGESIGADVGAMGFHIELLKQFKKELSE